MLAWNARQKVLEAREDYRTVAMDAVPVLPPLAG